MKIIVKFTEFLQKILPSPFTIAVLLTWLTFFLAWWLTPPKNPETMRLGELSGFWVKGFWELLSFSMQMMLMLVLGYVLALTTTIFSPMNLTVSIALLLLLPLILMWIAKKTPRQKLRLHSVEVPEEQVEKFRGADRLDHSRLFSLLIGATFLFATVYLAVKAGNLRFINLNYIIFSLFTLSVLLSRNVATFTSYRQVNKTTECGE